jgi:hypothetical protein
MKPGRFIRRPLDRGLGELDRRQHLRLAVELVADLVDAIEASDPKK